MTTLIHPNSFCAADVASACTPTIGVQVDPLDALFLRLKRQQEAEIAAQDREAERLAALIGSNGGPPLVEPFGIDAPWFQFAEAEEVERLAKLHVRIERRKLILSEDVGERKLIMKRCIRRMRRAAGKG
ncbi:hypothetical protein [Leisingera methylohalidivorans]|uniref:Uncharacterized protein n=1 Tax=Leisingera methylohalidivorans DSM 14336 TaxID=999552 RepID=V9VR10_9RHOB|nr:hypothetical protein [Leisingera methylohalidivorans]AHD00463.1 hypothetical protein METH_06765 [Leisingera methylohalidivorans DSM 14336]